MAENHIDYEVATKVSEMYSSQAEVLDTMITTLKGANDELQSGVRNKTADAFIERYDSEYKLALEKARDALQSISTFLDDYVNNRMTEDEETAGGILG